MAALAPSALVVGQLGTVLQVSLHYVQFINSSTDETDQVFGVVQSIQMQGQNIKSSTAANRTQEQYTIVQQYPTSHKKSAIKTMEHKTNDITDDDLETTRI
ncbi:uncharacterized protein LOC117188970 isoform X2 [Drosophila miranda]|uniref:uncharacterized protein LOC117188970 isoform X2 n=1 Tax=Drosophila miranda TaxID=7229 RepID=UPI00143F5AC4|nr:uncharacterized protein LOC117188970 isoform X2 [Drosophila miranda]